MAHLANSTPRRLEGKVAVVTGGASGIGETTVRLYVKYGAKVIIADIQDDRGRALCEELGSPENVYYVHCDVAKEADIENAVNTAVSRYEKLDIMFNNVGISSSAESISIFATEKSHFEKTFNVNVFGSFLGAKHAAKVMIPNKKGSIIFTSSAAASITVDSPIPYSTSKYAIVGLTNTMCLELGRHGIRVNCISPFMIPTPQVRKSLGGLGLDATKLADLISLSANLKEAELQTDDIAEAAVFLGGDESKYVSGLNLVVDGGYSKVNPTITLAMQNMMTQ